MSQAPVVGFASLSPAASAAGAGVASLGAALKSAAAGEAGGGLDGLFASLLALLDAAGVTPDASGITAATSTSAILPGGDAGISASTAISSSSSLAGDESATASGPKSIIEELSNALAAVEQSVENGTPLSPALRKKLGDTIDALAGLLGIALAGAAAPATAIADAAAGSGAVVTPDIASPDLPVPPAASGSGQATDPADSPNAAGDVTGAADQTAAAGRPADQNGFGKLVSRLEQLADAVAPIAPDLSRKLDALAEGLDAGDGRDILKKLGLDEGLKPLQQKLDAALATLAARPSNTAVQPSAPPPLFAPPKLAAPTAATAPSEDADQVGDAEAPPASARRGLDPTQVKAPEPVPMRRPETSGDAGAKAAQAAQTTVATATPVTSTSDAAQPAPALPGTDSNGMVVAPPAHGGITPLADARLAQAAYQPATPTIPYPQVAFEIARQFAAGNSKFQIRLDPPELGRIDVKLDVDKHGAVTARMTVDRSETLDLMQRDRGTLERALQQAGLDSGKTNLQFSLRQNPSGGDGGSGRQQPDYPAAAVPAASEAAPASVPIAIYRATASAGGVNLFV